MAFKDRFLNNINYKMAFKDRFLNNICYSKQKDKRLFEWFDNQFMYFVDMSIIKPDSIEYNFLLFFTRRYFKELLYRQLYNVQNIDDIGVKVISLTCFSLSLKYVLGYDWLLEEYDLISIITKDLLIRKKIVKMEFEIFPILFKLKCVNRINKNDFLENL